MNGKSERPKKNKRQFRIVVLCLFLVCLIGSSILASKINKAENRIKTGQKRVKAKQ